MAEDGHATTRSPIHRHTAPPGHTIAVVLKGYPRLSETFIAQELLGLERAGVRLRLISLRHPTDRTTHPVHDEIVAPVDYLPEYLHKEPLRVLKAWWSVRGRSGYRAARAALLADLRHDRSRNRLRRFGQALVLAAELPSDVGHLHAHFIHTPASVTRYASLVTGLPWTCSAHAKDIWTSSDRDLADKLTSAGWVVTCTATGHAHLQSLAREPGRVHLSYHGLDLQRFPAFAGARPATDGNDPGRPVQLLSVGRAVEKKGFDILLNALARLPADLHWQLTHIGKGERLGALRDQARTLRLDGRIRWAGALAQTEVLAAYHQADVFVLPCRIAADGDRDGLPNVLVEAASQRLACLSTTISGVPELITSGEHGLLVPPEDADALATALQRLIRDPRLRERLGTAAQQRVFARFDHTASIADLLALFASDHPAALRPQGIPA